MHSVVSGSCIVWILVIKTSLQQCTSCINGLCEDKTCWCYSGYTGSDCSSEICGYGICTGSYTCFNDNQCCSSLECTYPIDAAESIQSEESTVSPMVFVGLTAIGVVVLGLIGAVVFIRQRNSYRYRDEEDTVSDIKGVETNNKQGKGNQLTDFVPAADITSTDYVNDVTASWERTDSNAKLEDKDYVLPYTPVNMDSEEKIAWELPDETTKTLNTVQTPASEATKEKPRKAKEVPQSGVPAAAVKSPESVRPAKSEKAKTSSKKKKK